MIPLPSLSEHQWTAARALFAERVAEEDLLCDRDEPVPHPGPALLARWLDDPGSEAAQAVAERLERDPALAAVAADLLRRTSLHDLSVAQAAASAPIPERMVEGCRLHAVQSAAEPEQVYVILTLAPDAPVPIEMVLWSDGGPPLRLPLAEARRGVIQLLVDLTEPAGRLLADPATRVLLR